ncbi:Rap1a/Tai family immunity protein [Klebsiella variicola]|uniref:Rap1a/Tai family immunity protein n=1 Tax=Klebsiella variicola TaxID=244366 RepID=UPI0035A27FE3
MKKTLLTLVLTSLSFSSSAYFYDGNKLSEWNNSRKKVNMQRATETDWLQAGIMRGFVMGTFDSADPNVVCSDANVTVGQIEDVVGLYIDNHPEKRTKSAASLSLDALQQAFPCNR